MVQVARCRLLWRSSSFDPRSSSRLRFSAGLTSRYMSSLAQGADEHPHETNKLQLSGRVHIIGIGNVGSFIAHALASRQSRPPITLLMHHPAFYEKFRQKEKTISIEYNGLLDKSTDYDVEVRANGAWHAASSVGPQVDEIGFEIEQSSPTENTSNDHIECLIVCTKANVTERALRSLKGRLNSNSSILLMQNGMGIIEVLNKEVFKDPKTRPNYIQGVFSHGLMTRDRFRIVHKGIGTTILSPAVSNHASVIEADDDTQWAPTTKYLLRLLTLTPSLVATADTPTGLLQWQLEKLAVNCIINPLTALNDCKNSDLLYLMSATRIMRMLLFEISSVICALPELQGVPGIEARFAPERLRRQVLDIASKTGANTSSMAQDMKRLKNTEIDFLNGYIVRRGEELGIKCVLNYMIKHLINMKLTVKQRDEAKAIPIEYGTLLNLRETQRSTAPSYRELTDDMETPDDVETTRFDESQVHEAQQKLS